MINFLSSSIPTPNLPPDPKINFDDLILEKNKLFVGRDDIQKEFSTYVNKTKINYANHASQPIMKEVRLNRNKFNLSFDSRSAITLTEPRKLQETDVLFVRTLPKQ